MFNQTEFNYLECGRCLTVFVDPVPDADTFAKMYAKAAYHDRHYQSVSADPYASSARLIAGMLRPKARVLDYGCGLGDFMVALAKEGISPEGIEFDADAAAAAERRVNRPVRTVDEFLRAPSKDLFDAIHFGDVLEHLSDPAATLKASLTCLQPGGILFAEGPLENNPSPVLWAARSFGMAKRLLKRNAHGTHPPTHLFRSGAEAQKEFFFRAIAGIKCIHWEVFETGFPYSKGGAVKRGIAATAISFGGRTLGSATLGNRFRGIFTVPAQNAALAGQRSAMRAPAAV